MFVEFGSWSYISEIAEACSEPEIQSLASPPFARALEVKVKYSVSHLFDGFHCINPKFDGTQMTIADEQPTI